jgi:hypothetical protein
LDRVPSDSFCGAKPAKRHRAGLLSAFNQL